MAHGTDNRPGIFITFEGGDGAGKTTHIRFLAEALGARGYEVVRLREPGGTPVGEQLRSVVLNPANKGMSDRAELLLYEAARAQLVSARIVPALERGAVVLCDRFTDSTVAYQGFGRGIDRSFIDEANRFACQGIVPHRTILLTANAGARQTLARATHRTGADRLEQAGVDFHARVNEAFLTIARENPDRIRVVESAGKRSETSQAVFGQLKDLFPWMSECLDDPAFFAKLDQRHRHHRGGGQRGKAKR